MLIKDFVPKSPAGNRFHYLMEKCGTALHNMIYVNITNERKAKLESWISRTDNTKIAASVQNTGRLPNGEIIMPGDIISLLEIVDSQSKKRKIVSS